jgi:hypothetical protein
LARCPFALALTLAACRSDPSPAGSVPDAGGEDAPPTWQGDAGLTVRAPVQAPLHTLCGLSSNPGDLPIGDDAIAKAKREGYWDAAKELGGASPIAVRRDFLWDEIEPTEGAFSYAAYDTIVDEATAAGVPILGMLGYGNRWANPAATDVYWPPSDPATFARYAAKTAGRYQGRVIGWEIWNEPNGGYRFWKTGLSGDPAGYGALLEPTYDAIHAADPKATVLLGGTVFTPQLITGAIDWLSSAYEAHPQLAAHFDVAGIHTYEQYPPVRAPEIGEDWDAPLEHKIQMHAWLLAQHGAQGKPIWITELGWPVYDVIDEAAQARLTVRATILAARAGAARIFWYTLRDGPNPKAFPPEDAFGLLRNDADFAAGKDGTKKPLFTALRVMLAAVGERWVTLDEPRLAGLPADARAVRFHGAAGGDVLAVWTVTTPGATVTAARAVEVTDVTGAPRGTIAGGAPIAIGPDPIWLLEK